MLTFEFNEKNDQLEIHGDQQGLKRLANILLDLANENTPDHRHLMTADWGGTDLSEEKQGLDNQLYNHVKIFHWPEHDL